MALLPLISIPELETRVETRAFSETIHSRSYTHIIRNIVNDPATVFDDIVTNEQIQKRAEGISHYYDSLIEMTSYWHLLGEGTHTVNGKTVTVNLRELKKKLYLCLMSVNAPKRSALRQLRLLLRLCRTQTDGRQRQNYPPDRPR